MAARRAIDIKLVPRWVDKGRGTFGESGEEIIIKIGKKDFAFVAEAIRAYESPIPDSQNPNISNKEFRYRHRLEWRWRKVQKAFSSFAFFLTELKKYKRSN